MRPARAKTIERNEWNERGTLQASGVRSPGTGFRSSAVCPNAAIKRKVLTHREASDKYTDREKERGQSCPTVQSFATTSKLFFYIRTFFFIRIKKLEFNFTPLCILFTFFPPHLFFLSSINSHISWDTSCIIYRWFYLFHSFSRLSRTTWQCYYLSVAEKGNGTSSSTFVHRHIPYIHNMQYSVYIRHYTFVEKRRHTRRQDVPFSWRDPANKNFRNNIPTNHRQLSTVSKSRGLILGLMRKKNRIKINGNEKILKEEYEWWC